MRMLPVMAALAVVWPASAGLLPVYVIDAPPDGVVLLDGSIDLSGYSLVLNNHTTVIIDGATIGGGIEGDVHAGAVDLRSGSVGGDVRLAGFQHAHLTMSGGTIAGDVTSDWFVNLTGGHIAGDLSVVGAFAYTTWSGGTIGGTLGIADALRTTIIGTNFAIDGVPVGYGVVDPYIFNGRLTGTLANGDPIDNTFSHGWSHPDDSQLILEETPPALCGDQIDNDGDGRIDHPDDPECGSSLDDTEEFDLGCEVLMSQPTYVSGDPVNIVSLRFSNGESTPVTTRLRLQLTLPPPLSVVANAIDLGADGSFAIPANFDKQLGPVTMFTLGPQTPLRGNFMWRCALEDPATGHVISESRAAFVLQ